MAQQWVITWYDGDQQRVSIVDDADPRFPYGVDPSMIHDECEAINAIIGVDGGITIVVMDDEEAHVESVEP